MLSGFEIRFYAERVALFDDHDAAKRLYFHFYEKLHRFAFAIVKRAELADEIVSETFLWTWEHRAKLTEVENLNSYLYIIVKNKAIKEMSRERKNVSLNLNDIRFPVSTQKVATPEDMLLNNEMVRQLDKAVEALPPKCQLIYKLVKQDGLKYKEIASILNISVKTIDAQMAIATKRITQSVSFIFQ